MEDEDQILLNELKTGQKSAYEMLFKKYYKALSTKAYLMLEDEMEAEDLVQDLFVTMWQKSHHMSINTSLKGYLFRAVHNQCLMCLRKRKAEQNRFDNYTEIVQIDDAESFEPELYDYERDVNIAFSEIPAQRQKAFKLVYMENKKYKEAADEMGLSVNSVKTHLKLAIKMLQKKLINFK